MFTITLIVTFAFFPFILCYSSCLFIINTHRYVHWCFLCTYHCQSGYWLNVNGEAIFGTRPWEVCQNESSSSVYYTKKDDRLYAHFIDWPTENILNLNFPIATEETQARFLGLDAMAKGGVSWSPVTQVTSSTSRRTRAGIQLKLPALTPDKIPCDHAWVIVLTGITNL